MATAAVIKPYREAQYDHRAFDSLLSVEQSATLFHSLAGYEHLRSGLRDIFMRHGVNDELAVALLHRHFEMESNEKLVELGPVSSPWPIPAQDESVLGGDVLPHTWRVFQNELHAVEFRFVPKQEVQNTRKVQFTQAFFQDFCEYVKSNGLENIVGISQIEHGREASQSDVQLMEVTHGRNSIMVPAVDTSEIPGPTFQTVWAFVEKRSPEAEIDGVQVRHNICIDRMPADQAADGIQTHHNICIDRMPADQAADGIQARHVLCIDRKPADQAADGIQARHVICIDRKSADQAADGIQAHHNICIDRMPAESA
ncbi:hypothetical protein AAEP93_011483 [Penicillium crustosum]